MEGYGTAAVIYLKVFYTLPVLKSTKLWVIKVHSLTHTVCFYIKSNVWLIVFCWKQALSTESIERLPVFNKSALRHYQTSMEADDWCIPSREPKKLGKYEYSAWERGKAHTTKIGTFRSVYVVETFFWITMFVTIQVFQKHGVIKGLIIDFLNVKAL